MLHSVSGLATIMRSTSVERYAGICEPRGTARARTTNSMFHSDSNNVRNGTFGHLLNIPRIEDVSLMQAMQTRSCSATVVLSSGCPAPKNGSVYTEECNAAPHVVQFFIDTDLHCCAADKWKNTSCGQHTRGPLVHTAKPFCNWWSETQDAFATRGARNTRHRFHIFQPCADICGQCPTENC